MRLLFLEGEVWKDSSQEVGQKPLEPRME